MESTRSKLERITISEIDLPNEPLKEHDAQLFEKLKASITKRGQLKTIVVCINFEKSRYECLEGSKIVRAMKELGHEAVNAVMIEDKLSEADKKQIKLELSRDYFLTNYVLIGKMLKELAESEKLNELCKTIPFDTRQAENLIAMSDFDWEDFAQNKQVEGQISLFGAMFSDDEPDYSNVPVIEVNPDYVEPHIHKTNAQPSEVDKRDEGSVKEQPSLIEVAGTQVNVHEGNVKDVVVVENEDKTQAAVLFPEPEPEPILKEVVPELFTTEEAQKQTEDDPEKMSEKEFEELLDSRPTAVSEPAPEPAPLPEMLIDTDQPFYIDHRNVLVIKKYADQIIFNLPSIAEAILVRKEFEKAGSIDRSGVKISKKEEKDATIISHVMYVSKFDVHYTLKLKDVYDFLTKIDFEE